MRNSFPFFRCVVNGCDDPYTASSTMLNQEFLSFSVPKQSSNAEFLTGGEIYDQCTVYERLPGTFGCNEDAFNQRYRNQDFCMNFCVDYN